MACLEPGIIRLFQGGSATPIAGFGLEMREMKKTDSWQY